ncbi:MAG: type II toxin-antitoxin system HipA family toxin [Lachnospiraceae bacterium]|nr:type II toxin-antitoxin system HipA family toxin [Lachnospiraceae bacterium]MDD6304173.1 type II toxin-antitoxin system HipA family toxin [Lachnospiraceae bacterium]HCJ76877.1 toxin HipA [Roseburia sp.]
MNRQDKLEVFYHEKRVGTMALYQNRLAAFEYDRDWLADGFSISPFSLPLEKKVFMPKIDPFEGLFGVFADSLPDGWGRLLVDRLMKRNGIDPYEIGCLDRLAIVGNSGMGALTYRPVITMEKNQDEKTLDEIALECEKILNTETCDNLDFLFSKGGSSGGARPKILTKVEGEDWIIKFPSTYDSKEIGKQEYDYAMCAGECGIEIEKVRLFPSNRTKGYFGTKRFDRTEDAKNNRIHMVSASGLLETSHRIPNLDYDILMRLTLELTKSMEECKKLYRLMCFNVYAHNRDDHSKNFTYLYDENENSWKLSPAYDLTYSNSLGGEHATTVNGNGVNPQLEDLLAVAKKIGLNTTTAKEIAFDIRDCVNEMLREYIT